MQFHSEVPTTNRMVHICDNRRCPLHRDSFCTLWLSHLEETPKENASLEELYGPSSVGIVRY